MIFIYINYVLISDLISGYKCDINNKIREYEPCPLVYLTGVDEIDWKCNPLKPAVDQLKEWNSSFDKFVALKNSNYSNNIEIQ